ncbi:hypothetical protein ACFL3X_00935 [Gemmatimonadota bacterium]
MVTGLEIFVEHFEGMEESYILIGGAACDLWMGRYGLPFRVTKDLDVVLIIESLDAHFIERFWVFIEKAGYSTQLTNNGTPALFRFSNPRIVGYPELIELFCRQPFALPEGSRLAPFPAGDDQHSLSVILIEAEYYEFVIGNRTIVDDVPAVPASCLIPLKAKAFLNLTAQRRVDEGSVQMDHIKKHRNDVFRLLMTLTPDDRFDLPDTIKGDMQTFLDELPTGSSVWKDIRKSVNNPTLPDTEELMSLIEGIFQLSHR